ncbi:MAG: response regulator [Candidatus Eremiobacterota bacterium]
MKKKILIVEDEPMLVKMMRLILDDYDLLVAAEGKSGIKMAKEEKPDVIFMDLTLPGLNGYEALKEIRTFSETVPVVAMSAQKIPLSEIKEHGFDDYLEKPFDPVLLLKKIETFTCFSHDKDTAEEKNI